VNSTALSEQQPPTPGKTLPVATLLALTTVLPELFSGSTPLISFLNPGLLLFLFLGYGLAILLIRELAVRCRSGLLGLFFLGLAYSVFNEGLLAKTLIVEKNLPVGLYDHYGYLLGISFPWAAGIGAWHACASVIFPILLTHHFFPGAKEEPWLNGKIALILGLLLMFLACVAFLGISEKGVKGTPATLVVLLAIMFVGFLFGAVSKGKVLFCDSKLVTKPLLLGFSILIPFWGLGFLASAKAPVAIFFVVWLIVIQVYAWVLNRQHWLALPSFLFFGLGWYLHNVVQAAVFVSIPGKDRARALITTVVDGLILFLLFRQIRRGNRQRESDCRRDVVGL
jgi:hypothetical protein